jgi:hypothetical protein
MLSWPEPTDPVDTAAQRAATGYGSVEEALSALANAEVTFVSGPDGAPLTLPGLDGVPVVLVFTSASHAFMATALCHATLPAAELVRAVTGTGTFLLVNAGAAAPLFVPASAVPDSGAGAAAEGVDVSSVGPDTRDGDGPESAGRTNPTDSPIDSWPPTSGRIP